MYVPEIILLFFFSRLVLISHLDIVVGEHKQLIAHLQFTLPGGYEEIFAAPYHDNQGVLRDSYLTEVVAFGNHILGYLYFCGRRLYLFRQFEVKMFQFAQFDRFGGNVEFACHGG